MCADQSSSIPRTPVSRFVQAKVRSTANSDGRSGSTTTRPISTSQSVYSEQNDRKPSQRCDHKHSVRMALQITSHGRLLLVYSRSPGRAPRSTG